MYVNTNVAALNAWQDLGQTQSKLTNALQQLSSGNRINTAANDPAGLAISQQMLTQIDGMQQANTNAQAGISLLQTADGALGQIQNILQSMRSLASEAATATENPTDLSNLQTEMNQYSAEITQITNTTQFNNVNLLGGAYQNQAMQIGANQNQTLGITLAAADAFTLGVTGENVSSLSDTKQMTTGVGNMAATGIPTGTSYTLTATTQAWSASNYSQTDTKSATLAAFSTIAGNYTGSTVDNVQFTVSTTVSSAGTTYASVSYTDTNHSSPVTLASNVTPGANVTLDGVTLTLNAASSLTAGDTYTVDVTFNPATTSATLSGSGAALSSSNYDGSVAAAEPIQLSALGQAFTFDSGAGLSGQSTGGVTTYTGLTTSSIGTAGYSNASGYSGSTFGATSGTASLTATLDVSQLGSAASSYVNGTGNASATDSAGNASGVNISTQGNAAAALTVIDNAINTLSNERANVGAYQNRLQFAASDLQTSQTNLQAARAGITNADMALEMSKLSQYQILQQSGVAMLAQANAIPQALLKLLS